MTASTLNLTVTYTDTIRTASSDNRTAWNSRLVDLIKGINSGATVYTGVSEVVTDGATVATGTVTFSSTGATAADTVTLGGTTFTCADTPTGNQFSSGLPAVNAASLAAAFNATATAAVKGACFATAALGVVTFTASAAGAIGNSFTLAKVGTNIAVSGAKLTGGTSAAAVVWTY